MGQAKNQGSLEQGETEAKSNRYDNRAIAAELGKTARGDAYFGNALYVAKDIPGLTDGERECIGRWLTGTQRGTDHVRLQDIATKIAG